MGSEGRHQVVDGDALQHVHVLGEARVRARLHEGPEGLVDDVVRGGAVGLEVVHVRGLGGGDVEVREEAGPELGVRVEGAQQGLPLVQGLVRRPRLVERELQPPQPLAEVDLRAVGVALAAHGLREVPVAEV